MIPPFQGRLSTFGFADLLQWMDLNRRSGRLTVVSGRDRRSLEWKDGDIVYVSGSEPQDRLGAFLCRTRALPPATLHALLARNLTSDANLTRLILDGGHDTLAGLSRKVEELARRLLFEIFEWRDGVFRYDPGTQVERILRIRMGLRPQVLALQAAKSADDTRRRSRKPTPAAEARESLFEPEDVAGRFWAVVERMGAPIEPEEGRLRFGQAMEFAARLGERLAGVGPLRPIHEDSAALVRTLADRGPLEASEIEPIAALDPFLALDLVALANSLVIDRRSAVATPGQALEKLEPEPLAVLLERLAASAFPRVAAEDPAAATVRRASIAAAVAARRGARRHRLRADRGYALGLLHTLPYADLLAVAEEVEIEPGPFRAALFEVYRPLVGRLRAEAFNLPPDLEAVLTDEGTDSSPAAALVRSARATLPDCALGPLPRTSRPVRGAHGIARQVDPLLEFLGLPTSGNRPSRPRS